MRENAEQIPSMIRNQYRATIVTRAGSWRNASEICIRFAKEALVIPSASERLCKASFHGWPRSRARASYAEHTLLQSTRLVFQRDQARVPAESILRDPSIPVRCVPSRSLCQMATFANMTNSFSWKGNTIRGVEREEYGESLELILMIEMELQRRYHGRMMRADFHSVHIYVNVRDYISLGSMCSWNNGIIFSPTGNRRSGNTRYQ